MFLFVSATLLLDMENTSYSTVKHSLPFDCLGF